MRTEAGVDHLSKFVLDDDAVIVLCLTIWDLFLYIMSVHSFDQQAKQRQSEVIEKKRAFNAVILETMQKISGLTFSQISEKNNVNKRT